MVDLRQFCSERLEFCKWLFFCNLVLFQNPSQMAGILQTKLREIGGQGRKNNNRTT
jgi:hypothetical protein